ncbi:unnamed protein product [Arabis nemorensis]|uniref:SURP motif domain-containing protein n=1 Tax=Arabis nemorensis TaxID=586526 RepID=A0A565AT86_9BRAS|nr:unnamed protein product [Arabis nemorensis]
MMMQLSENDARYNFMWRSDPFHAFYRQKLTEYRSRNQQNGANHDYDAATTAYQQKLIEYCLRFQQDGANHDYHAAATAYLQKATEYSSRNQQDRANQDDDDARRIVLPHFLEVRLPKGMNVKEFRTMKLTAQFGAWYGNDFWLGFKNRAGFEFTNPTDSSLFSSIPKYESPHKI